MTIAFIASNVAIAVLAAAASYQAYSLQTRIRTHGDTIQELAERLDGKTHAFVGENAPDEWLGAAESADEERSVRLLRAAYQRFPGDREVAKRLFQRYRRAAQPPGELEVRRQAVLRLRQVVEGFLETCPLEDFSHALEMERKVDSIAEKVAEDIDENRRKETVQAVKSLEKEAQSLSESEVDDVALDDISTIDDEVDQEVLDQHAELREQYERASATIAEHVAPGDEDYDWEYNLEAVESAEEAWEMFQEKKESWTEGTKKKLEEWRRKANPFEVEPLRIGSPKERRIEEVAYTLGGWNSEDLLPAVNTYISSVHSEIFQELDREGRKIMTVKMIEASAKE
jgi:hypothetical protein